QPLARAELALEAEDRLVRPRTAHGDLVDIEAEAIGQLEPARADLHRVARPGVEQRLLQPLLRLGAGGDLERFGVGYGRSGEQRDCAHGGADHGPLLLFGVAYAVRTARPVVYSDVS